MKDAKRDYYLHNIDPRDLVGLLCTGVLIIYFIFVA